jgi:hypothetical protein
MSESWLGREEASKSMGAFASRLSNQEAKLPLKQNEA